MGEAPAERSEKQAVPPSDPNAVVRALRKQGDEAQFTRLIHAVCEQDAVFTVALLNLILDTAERDGVTEHVVSFKDGRSIKTAMCRSEVTLRAQGSEPLGRVDLMLTSADLQVLVEIKLRSGYGDEQVDRYMRAVNALSSGSAALVAITRDVPSYGEDEALLAEPRWLGSLRWSRLVDSMRSLPISNDGLEAQWQGVLEVMDTDGDLGTSRANLELVSAWSRYREGRAHLEHLLLQIQDRALVIVRDAVKKKYRLPGDRSEVADLHRRGKKRQLVVGKSQSSVHLGFSIPASVEDSALVVQFDASGAEPTLSVVAAPWDVDRRRQEGDPQLEKSIRQLEKSGFETDGRSWFQPWPALQVLDGESAPDMILETIRPSIEAAVSSGYLRTEIELAGQRSRSGPPLRKREKKFRGRK